MIRRGPQFLDEDGALPPAAADGLPDPAAALSEEPLLPRGPLLLDPESDAADRLDVGWRPEVVTAPRRRFGTLSWIAAGIATLLVSWIALSIVSALLTLFAQSLAAAALAIVATIAGLAMLIYAAALELRAYRSLQTVDQLRADLSSAETTLAVARREGRRWLHQVSEIIPDAAKIERMLESATSVVEVRAILRSQVADRLQEAARTLGKRAALEGGTLVAICPHPAWDGVIAGIRGLHVIRQVAALHGMRPGLIASIGLIRRVAWTAAGSAGLAIVSQGLADHALTNIPYIKHIASALPGTGLTAIRLYRLAIVTAEACSPVAN